MDGQTKVWEETDSYTTFCTAHFADGKPLMIHFAGIDSRKFPFFKTLTRDNNGNWADSTKKYGEFPDDTVPNAESATEFSIDISKMEGTNFKIVDGTFDGLESRIFVPIYGYKANVLMDGTTGIWMSPKEGKNCYCCSKRTTRRIIFVMIMPKNNPTQIHIRLITSTGNMRNERFIKRGKLWDIQR
ncbi:hypothetical protein BEWA_025480 [Theileria equi strain WA]|uniref:Uncharacterized protein n=1 Tax=Theileria equi strain WA TaxID=1537102 RepID=L0AXR3_THEEQ|nr:hypothetical protein BEWA_025480 [Theileria equi strain WA]AFZ79699.1 hypothetical protein BEWA_025480 [Theileria equi strain WA]|eukprot:XP_004829365.1 hypothetical protein BEWA_025480 [Theileria equi strain WA]